VAVAWTSSDDSMYTSGFVDEWMTSCFHIMGHMARIKDDACVSSSSPGGGTSWTSDNVVWSHRDIVCRVQLHLIKQGNLPKIKNAEHTAT